MVWTYDCQAPAILGRCSKIRADDIGDYHDEHDDDYSFIHYPSIHPSIVIKINFDFDQHLLRHFLIKNHKFNAFCVSNLVQYSSARTFYFPTVP